MNTFLPSLIFGLLVAVSHGQVIVQLQLERPSYLVNEPVRGVVTITNRGGSELFLHSKAEGRITRSWLEFSMRRSGGNALNRLNNAAFRAVNLPAGRALKRTINLSQLYGLTGQGNYSVSARVQIGDQVFHSNSAHFAVTDGTVYFKQPFGAPGTPYPNREYRLITFNDGKKTSIYAAVHDAKSKRSLATGRLSEALLFQRPQAAIDGKNNMHVLYLSNPEVFVHAVVNKDGLLAASNYYKRGAAGTPGFVTFASGEIKVRGGIPYDPKAEAAEQNRARRISDRPDR
ncbi:MAG: hypothetical protein ACSHYF_14300 [Verrucomicrobiaceae bacterium]